MSGKVYQKKLVERNVNTGTAKAKAFKAIIQKALYPKHPEHFSTESMKRGAHTFDALKKSGGAPSELIDLMLFYVECGTQFTCDYGDIDEDFYIELETIFEALLKLIKEHRSFVPLETYKARLDAIFKTAEDVGWGYGDQLKDLFDIEFPEAF